MSYFCDAALVVDGRSVTFSAADGEALESSGNYWHGPGDPSTWLAVAVFLAVRAKFTSETVDVALQLAAQNLGITVSQLRSRIDWHEQYMQWHDGDPDYRVL